ncbi:dihydrofolate reductase family protein [Jatrophihabitans sp.]|uniref:dihydrofolate reductase family protein n=1 Tax=Jatrophihabitans sp. TaxID=1932789 RepID=UPI002CC1B1B5|nr:dihydrofolate reductase family protein [Jatrophihabitans sp.]
MARTVIAALFSSVDGAVQSPNEWQGDAFDDDLGQLLTETIAEVDAVLLGRVTYSEWAGYWPSVSDDSPDGGFATFINSTPKYVASRTLGQQDLTWSNSHLIEGDLVEQVRAMKDTPGGTIAVNGSISVVRELFLAGVLDELTLIVHPVIAGRNYRRLFTDTDTTPLRLLRGRTTTAGNSVVSYALRA